MLKMFPRLAIPLDVSYFVLHFFVQYMYTDITVNSFRLLCVKYNMLNKGLQYLDVEF